MVHVLFVGAGRMAQAMISGMVQSKHAERFHIEVANRSNRERLEAIAATYQVHAVADWQQAARSADIIILAMPPADHTSILSSLCKMIRPSQFVVSVAAGIGVTGLARSLPVDTPVAWVMPNTASEVGQSMTLCAFGPTVSNIQQQHLLSILDGFGQTYLCTEEEIHQLTAITGSAPAFVFRIAGVMEQMAQSFGVREEAARQLVSQMLLGSAMMLKRGDPPAALCDMVTTPGGATAAGLDVLAKGHMEDIVRDAIDATNRRARELGG